MKTFLKHVVIILCIILVSLMGTYIGLAIYYHNAFAYGTWINNVYCTGRSIQEVNADLVQNLSFEGVTVYDKDGNSYKITTEQINYQFDFVKALEIYQKRQNPWMWIDSLYQGSSVELTPIVSYDRQALEKVFEEIPCLSVEGGRSDEDHMISIIKTNQGYDLLN